MGLFFLKKLIFGAFLAPKKKLVKIFELEFLHQLET